RRASAPICPRGAARVRLRAPAYRRRAHARRLPRRRAAARRRLHRLTIARAAPRLSSTRSWEYAWHDVCSRRLYITWDRWFGGREKPIHDGPQRPLSPDRALSHGNAARRRSARALLGGLRSARRPAGLVSARRARRRQRLDPPALFRSRALSHHP